MRLLFEGERFYDEILLSDLSLSYNSVTTLHSGSTLHHSIALFDNVSQDFLMDFFSCVCIVETIDLDDINITFRQCSIPRVRPTDHYCGLVDLRL